MYEDAQDEDYTYRRMLSDFDLRCDIIVVWSCYLFLVIT